jgi:hypothetical protein
MNGVLKLRSGSFIQMNRARRAPSSSRRKYSMRMALALMAASASVITSLSVPTIASAQEWREDPCRYDRHVAGRNGTVVGGVLGALIGSQVAGRGNRTAGALIGGGVGAVAGHQIGAHSVECNAYPTGYRYHAGCRWVTDRSGGRPRSFEVCRDRDGYWRPYDSRRDWRDDRDWRDRYDH